VCNTSVVMGTRGRGDAERAPLLATTAAVDCELGNGTVDREEEGARCERGRGRWVTKRRAAWVLGGCAVVAGAAACALGTRANGGSLMTWKSALGTKRENAAARRRARAVRSRREAARERRAEERRALEDHANDVLREIAREASPEDARQMVEEAIRRVEITKKSEAFAHAYDMARLGDEELVDDLEVDPHTIMDPKEFAKLTVDEKNALRRRMRTALRKVREELKTNAPSSARAKGQAAARRPGANVAAANASAAKRRRDAADANVRAKGEEKRKEISNDAEKLIQEIREGVEKTSSALREAAKEEGTKEAADKAEKDIAQLVHATNERIELIQKKTEKRLSLISAVTERHLSGRTSGTKTLTNAVTKSKPTVAADADSAEERQAARAEIRERLQAGKLKEREREQAKKSHDHSQRRDEDDHADVGGSESDATDEDSAAARQRARDEIRDKERAHKEMLKERAESLVKSREMRQEARKGDHGERANVGQSGRDEKRKASEDAAAERQRARDEIREKEQAKEEMLKERAESLVKSREMRQEARKGDHGERANVGQSGRDEKRKASEDAAAERQRARDEIREKEQAKEEAKEEMLRARGKAREEERQARRDKVEEKEARRDEDDEDDEEARHDEDEDDDDDDKEVVLRSKTPKRRHAFAPRRRFPRSRTALMGEEEQEYDEHYDRRVAALSEQDARDIEREAKKEEQQQEKEIAEESAMATELKIKNRREQRKIDRQEKEELEAKRLKEQRKKEALQRDETITRLQEAIAEEKSKHVKTKNFIGTIDDKLRQFEDMNDQFQQTLDTLEAQMKNISVEQRRMQSELDKDDESDRSKFNLLQERVEELYAKLMKWRKKQDRENNADRLDDGVIAKTTKKLQERLDSLTTSIEAWRTAEKKADADEADEAEYDALQDRIADLTSEIDDLESSNAEDSENSEYNALERRLAELTNKLDDIDSASPQSEVASMGASEYQALQSGIDALSSKVDVWGRRRNLGQAPGTSAHNEALKDRVEHRYPQRQYPVSTESKSKDAEADALKARVDQLTKKLDEANAERKRARKEATKEAKRRQKAETSALEERIKTLTEEVEEVSESQEQEEANTDDAMSEPGQRLNNQLTGLMNKIHDIEEQKDQAGDDAKSTAMQDRIAELMNKIDDLKKKKDQDEDEAKNRAMEHQIDELVNKIDGMEKKKLQDENAEKAAKSTSLIESRVDELTNILNRSIVENDNEDAEVQSIRDRITRLTSQVSAEEQSQSEEDSMIQAEQEAIKTRLTEMIKVLNETDTMREQARDTVLDAKNKVMEDRIEWLTKKLDEENKRVDEEVNEDRAENKAIGERIDALTNRLDEANDAQHQYPVSTNSSDAEADALKARVDELTEKLDRANAERERALKEATEEAMRKREAEKSALEERVKTLTEEVEDATESQERDALDAALIQKQQEADKDVAMSELEQRINQLTTQIHDVKKLRKKEDEDIASGVSAETRADTDDDAVNDLTSEINTLDGELGTLRQMHAQALADRAARARAEKESEEQEEIEDDIQDAKEINALKGRIDTLMSTIHDLEDEIQSQPADQKHYFDPDLFRKRPDGLDTDFGSPLDSSRESGVYYACDQPNQCMTSVTLLTHENKLLGMKGACGSGSSATDVRTGGYDMFPRRSSVDFTGHQCKVEFADDSRTFFVHSEDEAIVGLSKDGSENTECGRRTSTTAASAIKYQCTNPKACVVGYYVKNSYKNLDSARVEEDLTIQKVDFICSDGQLAVDPVTLRHDYGEISLEPEFSVKVANTPQADGTIKRIVTPYLALKTNTVVSGTFLMSVRIRDVTALAPADRAGWCTQQKVQAHLNYVETCREGSKLCAKTTSVYNPQGAEFVLKYGEQRFDLLDGDAHESSRIAITNRKDGLSSANAYSLRKIPMRPDEEFFKFGRSYEVCAAAIERSKFKTKLYHQSTGEVKESFFNRHLDGSARFVGSHSRAGGMQGGPRHFTATAPAAPTTSQMTALDCENCQVSGGVQPIADRQNLDGYPASPAATHPAGRRAYPADDDAEANVHAKSIRDRLHDMFLRTHE